MFTITNTGLAILNNITIDDSKVDVVNAKGSVPAYNARFTGTSQKSQVIEASDADQM